jgi:hypothetical protein
MYKYLLKPRRGEGWNQEGEGSKKEGHRKKGGRQKGHARIHSHRNVGARGWAESGTNP